MSRANEPCMNIYICNADSGAGNTKFSFYCTKNQIGRGKTNAKKEHYFMGNQSTIYTYCTARKQKFSVHYSITIERSK